MPSDQTENSNRRAMGELETELLRAVWRSRHGLTPAEALQALDGSVAYTTVLTVLTRLFQKELLVRTREGKAHRYEAAVGEADFVAGKMRAALNSASDHGLAMSHFVGCLSADEKTVLSEVLRQMSAEQ